MSTYNQKSISELRSNAKGQLIGRYQTAICVSLVMSSIELVITTISESAYTGSISSYLLRFAISLIIDLLMGILVYGQVKFYLNLVRGKEPLMVSDLFYGFKHETDKAILIQAIFTVTSLIAGLPAVLISVGVITIPDSSYMKISILLFALNFVCLFIAKLFCGLCFYILNDHPDYSVPEVIRESIRLMSDKKGRYILTCLSLIPVMLLSVFAFCIGILWFVAYYQTVITNFYLDAINEEPFNQSIDRSATDPGPDDYSI